MRPTKTHYQLSESQVTTPSSVVSLFWKLALERRPHFGSVLDIGAGDCRFAKGGVFDRYVGLEIDPLRTCGVTQTERVKVIHACAFEHKENDYDACIGNPPYVRHHHVESPWKEEVTERLKRELGVSFNRLSNFYLYFLSLGLLKTRDDGLLALVIPYEWVSRPSARGIREYIQRQKWEVHVYRFTMAIFDGVLTTASISIIDKSKTSGRWSFSDILSDHTIQHREGTTNSTAGLLPYSPRGRIWAMRGLSPGTQQVFTLTEGERIHHGLSKKDVLPCVTTLRECPIGLKGLNHKAFYKHFVKAGERCWLIRSNESKQSKRLTDYLSGIPESARDNYTCQHQEPWFNYRAHPVPRILVNSGFTKYGPKILVNSFRVHAVGSVLGVHSDAAIPSRRLREYLSEIDFEKRLVAHAKKLKKIEVKQLNGVLNEFDVNPSSNE